MTTPDSPDVIDAQSVDDSAPQGRFNVGGYALDRPFKIRRFGHFGYNVDPLDACVEFYTDLLGFRITDEVGLFSYLDGRALEVAQNVMTDDRMYFTGYAGDHHSLLLAHASFGTFNRNDRNYPDNTISQITWQVSSLTEIVEAEKYLTDHGARIVRVGRDMPGGNWHVYFLDPDGNTVELYYGMEQIGWDRRSRPRAMHAGAVSGIPELPVLPEIAEVYRAVDDGVDFESGWRPDERHLEAQHDVDGVLLPRPFKIVDLGPLGMYCENFDAMVTFHTDALGLQITESAEVMGHRVVHLRHGHEHHSIVLAEKALRAKLGTTPTTSNIFIGVRVGTYQQLRAAVAFLAERGFEPKELPEAFSLGQGYTSYVQDPAGHLVQLTCEMEQLGWSGEPRPAAQRRQLVHPWPEMLEGDQATFGEPAFWGPIG